MGIDMDVDVGVAMNVEIMSRWLPLALAWTA